MNALKTLKSGEDSEDSTNVNSLLHGTHEIELRLQQINRWFRLWRKDARDGWVALGRFKVSPGLTFHYRYCKDCGAPQALIAVSLTWRVTHTHKH